MSTIKQTGFYLDENTLTEIRRVGGARGQSSFLNHLVEKYAGEYETGQFDPAYRGSAEKIAKLEARLEKLRQGQTFQAALELKAQKKRGAA